MLRRAVAKSARSSGLKSMTSAALPPPTPLPPAQSVVVDGKCLVEYVDVAPTEKAAHDKAVPTIVLVHGAPGTYRDFRHLVPMLSANARVVAVNMPGFGDSKALQKEDYFAYLDATTATKTMVKALKIICKDDSHVFIVGHSFGGHTAIQIAKSGLDEQLPNVKGLALLASASHRPHQSLWPRFASVLTETMKAEVPVISPAAMLFTRWFMTTFVGFPKSQPANFFVAGLMRQTSTDYDYVMQQLRAIDQLPTLHAWSKNDIHIEEELSLALSEACGPGPRFVFERGGHNIQKTRAPFVAEELLEWVNNVIDGRVDSNTNKTPKVLE